MKDGSGGAFGWWGLVASISIVGLFVCFAGCGRGPVIVPVEGRVFYNDRPLEFGGVMFQPEGGQPARGSIRPDGTFVLGTNSEADGATVGPNKVRITCYGSQRQAEQAASGDEEMALGALMIPRKYVNYATSGLQVDVQTDGNEPFVFRLTDDKAAER